MKPIKKSLALFLCLTMFQIMLPPLPARADDSDIFGANIEPNIMVFLDSSGSMDDTIAAAPYDPNTTYTGTKTSTIVYKKTNSGYGTYANTIADVTLASARTALTTNGYWSGKISGSKVNLYTGNYLNYTVSPAAAQEKKMVIAKRVLTTLINNTEGVRFGLSKFRSNSSQGSGGATILAPVGSTTSTLLTALSGVTSTGYTPLGEALRELGNYFKGTYTGYTSPIQYDCQPNFIILMSDGLQNGSVDVRTEATLRRTQDHATATGMPGLQNVLVHTVGFAVGADEADAANDVLQTAATNGGGTFYSTQNEAQLEAALEDAIRQIMAATFAFATPVVPTTSATGISRAYLAAFQSNPSAPFWRGYVKAYQRGADGLVPTDTTTGLPTQDPVWEAGAQLNALAATNRNIYTYVGGSRVEFKTTTTAITTTLLGVTTAADRTKVIDFLRGVDATDENFNGDTAEDRAWKLGDIFHSSPVLVTPPFLPSPETDYQTFRAANATRPGVLLAGANDGMLHAFRETDGVELWGFIPPNILNRLKELITTSGDHPFLVDGSPVAADVKIGGAWKTVVLFGERRGGNSYHALDITDTTNPVYLWSFTDTKIAETWSEPAIGKVKMDNGSGGYTEKYVAFFGGGYNSTSNNASGKALFAVDMATGAKLWEYYNATGSSDDKQYMNYSIPANPLALDMNGDGFIDRLYIGDIGGQLWKFDLSANATLTGSLVNNWTGKRLFRADTATANPPASGEFYPSQAIYGAPNASYDEQGNLWVYVGTGDRNHPNNTSSNRFYGIKDNTTMTNGSPLTEGSLTDITSTTTSVSQGWYVRLSSNEKVLAQSDVFNKVVFFSSFTPTTTTSCGSGGGTAKLYAIQMTSGYAAVDWSTNQPYTTSSASNTRGKTIGTGIPSKPIVIITDSGATLTTSVIAATTSQQLPSNPAPPPSAMRTILYWREIF